MAHHVGEHHPGGEGPRSCIGRKLVVPAALPAPSPRGGRPRLTRGELYTYVGAPNAVWVLCPLLGLYVSLRLILDGNYGVLGS